ncbi:Rap1a/Tai family immunity protein [Dentiradicibacter hellwigii]|uniref:Rap1a/Tai family immunity protein n=1 Tax=Dentiradicibacter hellwigii TaxID=3149053 RepID=A0ABV4UGC5_9RHOO
MLKLNVRCLIMLLFLGISVHVYAETKLLRPLPDSQSLIIENNNLTAAEFFAAFMSKNIVERRYAEMYLLGVLDATEGTVWCDYYHIKTISLNETIYEGLKKADPVFLQKRAALVIMDILKKDLSCKAKNK